MAHAGILALQGGEDVNALAADQNVDPVLSFDDDVDGLVDRIDPTTVRNG